MSAARAIREHGGDPNNVRRYLDGPSKQLSSPNGAMSLTIEEIRWQLLQLFMQKRSTGVAKGIARRKAGYREALSRNGNGSSTASVLVDKWFWRTAQRQGFEDAEAAIGISVSAPEGLSEIPANDSRKLETSQLAEAA